MTTLLEFENYSAVLDKRNTKFEKIYKINRDVTIKSKKVIFSLQRIPGLKKTEVEEIFAMSTIDLDDIAEMIFKISLEIQNEDSYQFLRAYTGGIQEYIEALTFFFYLAKEKILTFEDVQLHFRQILAGRSTDEAVAILKEKDYILGIADLTGELLRYCVKSICVRNFDVCFQICTLLRIINEGFLSMSANPSKELLSKKQTLKMSLLKVEKVQYELQLYKSELSPDRLDTIMNCCDDSYLDS